MVFLFTQCRQDREIKGKPQEALLGSIKPLEVADLHKGFCRVSV